MPGALVIAIVGAESTGKTTLARQLAARLAQARASRRVAWVPEWLREWCTVHGRTPRADEQAAIAARQHERIGHAAAAHDVVVADTTALMTAVYSRIAFGDRSLDAAAVALHREAAVTLVTAIDLPWVADGHQRDGEHVREPVDVALRELLREHGIEHAVVAGRGPRRVEQALAAATRHAALREGGPQWSIETKTEAGAETAIGSRAEAEVEAQAKTKTKTAADKAPPTSTLFSRLLAQAPPLTSGPMRPRGWVCDCCVPDAERTLLRETREVQARRR